MIDLYLLTTPIFGVLALLNLIVFKLALKYIKNPIDETLLSQVANP